MSSIKDIIFQLDHIELFSPLSILYQSDSAGLFSLIPDRSIQSNSIVVVTSLHLKSVPTSVLDHQPGRRADYGNTNNGGDDRRASLVLSAQMERQRVGFCQGKACGRVPNQGASSISGQRAG